jgi:ATP-dependent RNA helicase DeaD
MTVLFVGAGREAGIRPGDIVGAITGEAKITNRQVGGIKIGRTHTLVEVPEPLADRIVTALRRTSLRGRKVDVRRAAQ